MTVSRLAPSQWETPLQSNGISHWLGTNLESSLYSDQSTNSELTYVIVNNSFSQQHGNDKVISVKWIYIIYKVGEWYFLIFNYVIKDFQSRLKPTWPPTIDVWPQLYPNHHDEFSFRKTFVTCFISEYIIYSSNNVLPFQMMNMNLVTQISDMHLYTVTFAVLRQQYSRKIPWQLVLWLNVLLAISSHNIDYVG